MSSGPARRAVTSVRVCAVDGDTVRDRPDKVVTEEPMEIRLHGPGQEPEAARGHHAHARERLRARGRLLPHRGAAPRRADELDTVAYCLAGQGEQEYNIVTVKVRHAGRPAPGTSGRSWPTRAAGCAARRRSTTSSSTASPSARARSSPGRWSPRCPTGCAPRRPCSTPPAGSTQPARFTRRRRAGRAARRRRSSQRARQARRARAARTAAPARRRRAHGLGPGQLRDRAEGGDGRHPGACARCRRPRVWRSTRRAASVRPSWASCAASSANVYTHPERLDLEH